MLPQLNLTDFQYQLPEDRIAQFPLERRDESKLLVYQKGDISHRQFKNLPQILPSNSTLIVNDTQVIPARLIFRKETGALIEIFLLSPLQPFKEMQSAMSVKSPCTWQCMVGNQKRWKQDQVLKEELILAGEQVTIEARQNARNEITFSWDNPNIPFEQIVGAFGQMPLPPYMKRAVQQQDHQRYQTVYAASKGAVAAPTAGLHFTDDLLQQLQQKGVQQLQLTLHVGAGTFQPIKDQDITAHPMHREQMLVDKATIKALIEAPYRVAVGTTSLRTLESLYWYGVKLINGLGEHFFIEKLLPYQHFKSLPPFADSLSAILNYMQLKQLSYIQGSTEIFIFPTYEIRSIHALITNFHLPQSTLILLVAALVGDDWRKIYQSALDHEYRFLSYGDSSVLFNPRVP